MIDSRAEAQALGDYPLYTGAVVTGTRGRLGLKSIDIRQGGGSVKTIDCDALGVSGGWNPSVHLTCHMNGRPVWNPVWQVSHRSRALFQVWWRRARLLVK